METTHTNILSRLQNNARTWISAQAGTDSDWGEAWLEDGKIIVGWSNGDRSPIGADDPAVTIHDTASAAQAASEADYAAADDGETDCGLDEGDVDGATQQRCDCSCDCEELATGTDDSGSHVCDECSDYHLDDGGEVVCSRMQDDKTCRDCSEPIVWGDIQTGSSLGMPMTMAGRCSCREWQQTEHGGHWRLSEGEVRS